MKNTLLFFSLFLLMSFSKAQLADGSIAPDFTFNDINGNPQNLYTYLDSGKTVYLDIFAAHCTICWSYHTTYALRDLYNNHGPAGAISDEIMVLAIEHDPANGMNELTGVSGATAGNWVAGTPYPIINPEGLDRSNFITAYDAVYYPMIYAICPDRKITLIGTQNEAGLYNHVSTCAAVGLNEVHQEIPQVYFNSTENGLYIKSFNTQEELEIKIIDLTGKKVLVQNVTTNFVSINSIETGLYIYLLVGNAGTIITGKFYKP